MFNGPAPVDAVRLLHRLGLFPTVFALPPPLPERLGEAYGAPCVACMAAADGLARSLGLQLDKDERRFLLLAALMLPLRGLAVPGAKGKPTPAPAALIRDSLKWRVKDIEMSAALAEAAAELAAAHAVLNDRAGAGVGADVGAGVGGGGAAEGGEVADVRVMLGQVIRKLKQHWRLGVVLAPVILMRSAEPLGQDAASGAAGGGGGSEGAEGGDGGDGEGEAGEQGAAAAAARLEMARELLSAAEAYGLAECYTWKPLMDGKKVMSLLGWSKAGPELGKVLSAVMDWQLKNPSGGLAEAEELVKQRFGSGAGKA
ncbi:hypothetical protein HYH03_001118 [Edaphochlamys debaryana]|uniref:tRNA nucleotidyltransferase/poly(A) polymerase RNA and SrmB- binding domain-containing protein n=1 Tax=Edaphochlamys debaryana TaxID=47281 RepID=A0A836C5Y5_9CHLO|nr:hypothetical protein HYH03_001118 [Edaphochlamys debaryana]|eukprot:KAG2501325.1 hypothetical protein HYH03_001118 [Edaphochlamys debaryana]